MTALPSLVLTAHGSVDPRSSATTRAMASQIRRLRPGLDVRVAFCEKSAPNLGDVLAGLSGPAVVTPLLLASAYHARVDIPAIVAESGAHVLQADTLGEDPRLVQVLVQRLAELGDRLSELKETAEAEGRLAPPPPDPFGDLCVPALELLVAQLPGGVTAVETASVVIAGVPQQVSVATGLTADSIVAVLIADEVCEVLEVVDIPGIDSP